MSLKQPITFYYHQIIFSKSHALHASSYLLKSRATYLFPIPSDWGYTNTYLFESSSALWHLILQVVLYSSMWLCLEIEHCMGRDVWGTPLLGSLPLVTEQGTVNPIYHISHFTEEKYSSPFIHLCTCFPFPYTLSHITPFHLKTPYCIYD